MVVSICVEQFYDKSYLPQDPISFLLFLLVIISYQDHSTDAGIELMMIFFNQVLMLCGSSYRFPKKVTTFKVWARLSERMFDGVKPYVMCQLCHAMYPYGSDEEIMQINNGKRCNYKDTLTSSVRCGNELFIEKKPASTSASPTIQIPKKMFYYNTISATIQKFLKRPDIVYQLENRKASVPGFYSDIKDGNAFRTFKLAEDDHETYVNASNYNLLITINVDWFSLSKGLGGSPFTLGGMYATIQNLERGQRNKNCNSILVAILPGPKEATMSQMNR